MSLSHDTLKALHEAATPGPWDENFDQVWHGEEVQIADFYGNNLDDNAKLTSLLRNAVPEILALIAERDAMRGALESAADFLETAPIESGVCCCGDAIDSHGLWSGHSPVDAACYAASQHAESIRSTLAALGGNHHGS